MDSKDPYCGWNEFISQCTGPPDKKPLTFYWNQLINECPTFSHPGNLKFQKFTYKFLTRPIQITTNLPKNHFLTFSFGPQYTVPGSWSKWSAWVPCNQAGSLSENDQCMCSTRQCNNPAPQNGGAECEGAQIQVKFTVF